MTTDQQASYANSILHECEVDNAVRVVSRILKGPLGRFSTAEWIVLLRMNGEQGGRTARDVASWINTDRQYAVKVLRRLTRIGLLDARRARDRTRHVYYSLADHGASLVLDAIDFQPRELA